MVMMENYNIKSLNFMPTGKIAIGIKYTKESMEIIEHLSELGYLLFHHRNDTDQHLFSIGGTCSVVSADEIEQNVYKNVNTSEMYILVNFITEYEIDSNSLCSTKKGYTAKTRYDAQYSTLHDLINNAFNQ